MLTTIKTYSPIIPLSMGQNNYHVPHSLSFQRLFYFLFLPFQIILLLIQIDNIPTEPFSHVGAILIAVVIGFVIALIATGIMRLDLHSVYSQPAADNYIKKNSLRLTRENELFLYKNVTRTEKPKENSLSNNSSSGGSTTHTSSSGRTHGGGGGKF